MKKRRGCGKSQALKQTEAKGSLMAGIQFILGRSGTGKTRWCLDAVCAAMADGGDEPLILLVPEQATYQVERAILSYPGIAGFSQLRVLSFDRLGFWLNGVRQGGVPLSRTGRQMAIHKLLLDLSDRLRLYKGDTRRTGLAGKLSDLLSDLQASNCTARQIQLLAEALSRQPGQELAAVKWADIAAIFTAYEHFFESSNGQFVNPDGGLTQAKKNAAAASFLHGARLWVDGFSGFSGQELDLLAELLRACSEASIALCLNPGQIDLDNDDEKNLDPCSLFALTEQTYCQLRRVVRACGLTVKAPLLLGTPRRFEKSPALAALEAALASSDTSPRPHKAKEAIHIAACGSVRAETLWMASTIRRLVKDEGLRYRDIAVVVPDMGVYQHYIESAFSQYAIPHFLDRPRQMKAHPLVELTGSALQAARGGFMMADVLSFLKSGMAGVSFEAVDDLETYCRAFDIQTHEWTRKPAWDFASDDDKDRYDQPRLDALRRQAVEPLVALRDALTRRPTMTAGQFTQAVWKLLETLDAQTTLAKLADSDPSDQQFGHRQLFSKLLDLMDELCGVFGDTTLSADAWGSIFIEALSNVTVKLIPPTLDQVLVGSIERSRHPDVQAIFLGGAVQKQFPVPVMGETLLTDQDYQAAQAAQMELANPYGRQLMHRPYLSYIALTRASSRLFISYPLMDEKGASVVPWSGIEQLDAMFADAAVAYPQTQADEPADIQTQDQLGRWLCSNLGKDRQKAGHNETTAAGVMDRAQKDADPAMRAAAEQANRALAYNNTSRLDGVIARKLFTSPITTSVTRLGSFAACPYQYFARYVLRLEVRQRLELEPMDVGKFYHDVLERMFGAMKECGRRWGNLTDTQLVALCNEQIDAILNSDVQLINFMRRRAHHRHIIQSAEETIRCFVPALAQLSRAGTFEQEAAELEFGPQKGMELVIRKDGKPFVLLSGRIDRLDIANIDGQPAGVVFDYKSGTKKVEFTKILYGLDLQLPVYLLTIRQSAQRGSASDAAKPKGQTIPAGAFFLPIDSGIDKGRLSELAGTQAAFGKAHGLFDGRFSGTLDTTAAGGWNRYYNFYTSKDGDPYGNYKNSGALKPEDFAALLNYTEACVRKLVQDLSAGRIDITPYRLGTESPCTWCDYRSVCRFDWQVNDYNILETCDKEHVLEKMNEFTQ